MLMWADIEREWGLDNPMADQVKVREARTELRRMLIGAQRRPRSALSELDEFRQALGPKRQKTVVAPSEDPAADLAELRSALSRSATDD